MARWFASGRSIASKLKYNAAVRCCAELMYCNQWSDSSLEVRSIIGSLLELTKFINRQCNARRTRGLREFISRDLRATAHEIAGCDDQLGKLLFRTHIATATVLALSFDSSGIKASIDDHFHVPPSGALLFCRSARGFLFQRAFQRSDARSTTEGPTLESAHFTIRLPGVFLGQAYWLYVVNCGYQLLCRIA